MSPAMRPLGFRRLLEWALSEFRERQSTYGVPATHFFRPVRPAVYETSRPFAIRLGTPVGPAAGPHTQMAQNIVCAWLCGGRFIELKTVQILDRLEIPRPCIDAADEGYNVEWSQELSLDESASEYATAWALVHALARPLGVPPGGVVFNASVGYTLEGIRSSRVQTFLDTLSDARPLLDPMRRELRLHGRLCEIEIPDRVASTVTLSTMHGCPPEEIEQIARHLLVERELHTTIKLNPTLLGREALLDILHHRLGFVELDVPESAFAHDLRWDAALDLIASLRSAARQCGRMLVVKLSNTLALRNHRDVLPGNEAYLSGRALYPVTIELFRRLREAIGSDVPISFSAGADEINFPELVASGACPVTMATDLLKPGGYGRLRSALDRLGSAMEQGGATSVDEFAEASLQQLPRAAAAALEQRRYHAAYAARELPKLTTPLARFDCVVAPCVATCPAHQDVPAYAALLAAGHREAALASILRDNPLPAITGHICTARCELRCTRANLDEPVRIRDLKRFAEECDTDGFAVIAPRGVRVAVVGAGPAGLAAAAFLARSGVAVTLFEATRQAGGMPAIAPGFRLPRSAVVRDVRRIEALGVDLRLGHPVANAQRLLEQGYAAVFLACGLAEDAIPDELSAVGATGWYGALDFLRRIGENAPPPLGPRTLVVGGGNTAIDAARSALRLSGGSVSIVYRRRRAEMPADPDEIEAFLVEGGTLLEQVAPRALVVEGGRVVALDALRTLPGPAGPDGRASVQLDGDSPVRFPADVVLLAVGQRPARAVDGRADVARGADGAVLIDEAARTSVPGIYAGGDATRGPATIVEAIADGRRAALSICSSLAIPFCETGAPSPSADDEIRSLIQRKRAVRSEPHIPVGSPAPAPRDFRPVTATLAAAEARAEAERCLQCALFCDKCVDVCPNRANVSYRTALVDALTPVVDLASGRVLRREPVRMRQTNQILHIDDLCNECGNCTTFCVHDGRPFADKPRLLLRRSDLAEAAPGAFCLDGDGLLAMTAEGGLATIRREGDDVRYADDALEARVDAQGNVQEVRVLRKATGERSLTSAVELAALWRALRQSAPFLCDLMGREKGVAS